MRHILILCLVLSCLPGCSASEDMDRAEAAVVRFHQQMDAGEAEVIYKAAAQEFKQTGSETDLVALFQGVHDKLGRYKSGHKVNWKMNYGTSGEVVILDYQSEFENGEARENFVFRLDGDTPVLLGYHVSSNAFLSPDHPRKT